MHCRAVIYLIAITTIHPQSIDSLIVQGPSDTTAMVNESTYFNCSTSIRPVDVQSIIWFHFPLDAGGQRNYIYDDGRIMTNYRNRFDIDIDLSSGKLNLLILRLEPKDAGRYECRDDVHADIGASAELTILDSDVICESDMDPVEVVGPTECDRAIPPDELQLSCRVTFTGGNAPQLVWRKAGESPTTNKTNCVTKYNRVTCNTTLTANLQLNGAVYICESTTQHYKCSLEINNVLYAFSDTRKWEYDTGNEVSCVANASRQLSCSYKWLHDNTTAVFSHENFKPTDPGLYRCRAHCLIQNDSCKFTAMVINVSSVPDSGPNFLQCLWLLLIPAIIGVILAIQYRSNWSKWLRRCRCNNRNKRPSSDDAEEGQPLTELAEGMKTTSSKLSSSQLKDATNGEEANDETSELKPNEKTNVEEANIEEANAEEENVEETIIVYERNEGPNVEEGNEETNEKKPNLGSTVEETNAEEVNVQGTDKDERNYETNVEERNEQTNEREPNEESNVEKTNEKQTVECHREFLKGRMDPDTGLLDTLRANKTLSGEEMFEVKENGSFYKRNSQLLDYIFAKEQYDGLIDALKDNEQLHIVNYLNANGEYYPKYGDEWPLTNRELSILDDNQKPLIDLLELGDLLHRLCSSKIINKRQMQCISAKPTPYSKTEALLEILRRRSLRDYKQTICCLRLSNQSHIAEVFESGGVVAEVHTHLDGPLEKVIQAEDEIITRIETMLSGSSIEESRRILELLQMRIIAAKKGQSIVLYLWCETVDELLRLNDLLTSGLLKDHVEQLFNQKLTLSQTVAVINITMNDEEFKHMKAYFTENKPVVEGKVEQKKMEGLSGSLLEGRSEFISAIKKENKEKRLIGVTVLKHKLFVASENSSALKIYDVGNKFKLLQSVPVPDLVNPFDIACCDLTECVFISDSKYEDKPKEIIRIESSMTVGKRWWTGDDFGNLSVSSESNIILCVSDKNMFIEYTKDGETVRVINLSDIVHPRHAIKLISGEFMISHGCKNDTLHRVCNVSSDGEVIKSFGGEKGTSLQHLNEPNYLTVDEEGSVFVADRGNERVLLLNSNLNVKREFLTRNYPGIINPGKMCRCKDTHNLYMVGLDAEYRVLIFIIE